MIGRSKIPSHGKPDFNGDGFTDIIWSGADQSTVVWNMGERGISGVQGTWIPNPDPWNNFYTKKAFGDFNGDGTSDLLWQAKDGVIHVWHFKNNQVVGAGPLEIYGRASPILGVGDFNDDGKDDVLSFSPPFPEAGRADGIYGVFAAEERKVPPTGLDLLPPISIDWKFVGIGDFNGDANDGKAGGGEDLLFRGGGNATVGRLMVLEMNPTPLTAGGGNITVRATTLGDPGPNWSVLALGDFNGDGKSGDIAWEHTNNAGEIDARSIWLMSGTAIIGGGMLYNPGSDWELVDTGDYNNDGKTDLMWHHSSGWYAEWLMNGAEWIGIGASFDQKSTFWQIGGI